MAGDHCINCRFFDFNVGLDNDHGECRRNPPVFLPKLAEDVDAELSTGYWPMVSCGEWCGEYRPLTSD